MSHPTRSATLSLVACAALAIACKPYNPNRELAPLLPMDEAAPAFIAANCAVPVKVVRTSLPQGSSRQTFIEHFCEDLRDIKSPRTTMGVQFNEDTRQIVYMYLYVSADTTADVDAQFNRVYAALIDPYVTPLMRRGVRKFSKEHGWGNSDAWSDFDRPGDSFQLTVFGEPEPSVKLLIRPRFDVASSPSAPNPEG